MKRQGLPIWLLRDFPAFLGVMISFWPLMILVITNGFKAMRGKKVRQSAFDDFPILLAHAESRLDFAIWREAYRRLGWNPRDVEFTLVEASDDWDETTRRFQSYQRAGRNLEACARHYVEVLRQRYRIAEREFVSAPLRAPLATFTKSSLADRRGRWIAASSRRDGGGCVRPCARGPPLNLKIRKSAPPHLAGPICENASARANPAATHQIPETPKSRH